MHYFKIYISLKHPIKHCAVGGWLYVFINIIYHIYCIFILFSGIWLCIKTKEG